MNTSPEQTVGVLINRRAGGRRVLRFWEELRSELARRGRVARRLDASDAETAAWVVAHAEVGTVMVAGGDGTVQAAINGLCAHPTESRPALAVVGFGTGNDTARQIGLPPDPVRCAEQLTTGTTYPLDVLRVEPKQGFPRYAINSTGLGFVGSVLSELDQPAPRVLRSVSGRLFYLVGTLAGWRVHEPAPAQITLDGEAIWDAPAYAIIVANGSYFGGGIPIAPIAERDDGLLDVILVQAADRYHLLRLLPLVYAGSHLQHPAFRHWRGRVVDITGPGLVDADGERLGSGGLRAEVVPGAIRAYAGPNWTRDRAPAPAQSPLGGTE